MMHSILSGRIVLFCRTCPGTLIVVSVWDSQHGKSLCFFLSGPRLQHSLVSHALLVLSVFIPSLANCTIPVSIALSVGGTRSQHLGNEHHAFGLDMRANGVAWDAEI